MLRQLADQSPHLSPTVTDCYDRHFSARTRPLERDYPQMIRSEAARYRKIYIIIDGLDECRSQTRLDLLNLVNQVLESHADTHLLVSSRRVNGVGANLKQAVKLNMQAKPEDISKYIDKCIERMAGLQTLTTRHPDLATEIKDKVTDKASGMSVFSYNRGCDSLTILKVSLSKAPHSASRVLGFRKSHEEKPQNIPLQFATCS
jgi:hypothetical protein